MIDLEKEFYSLLCEFSKHNVLEHLVLIGSWTLPALDFEVSGSI